MPRIIKAQIWPLKGPLTIPIRTSFGQMDSRPALLLSLTDDLGNEGWGESWVNFPEWAVYERTMVLNHLLGGIVGREVEAADMESFYQLYRLQAVQWGGIGPFAQAVSAMEGALWDLEAKQRRLPLYKLLAADDDTRHDIPVYASGIGPANITERIERAVRDGFRSVKIKVGFDSEIDHNHFQQAKRLVGREHVMVDANQAWTGKQAETEVAYYQSEGARWVEEPVSAIRFDEYQSLCRQFDCIAAGENWYLESFACVQMPSLSVYQPDLCKIGGIWAADKLSRKHQQRFLSIAFHVLGTAVCHSLALQVAAAWGDRVSHVEFDTNENPFRAAFNTNWKIEHGQLSLPEDIGLGIAVDHHFLRHYFVEELRPFCQLNAVE